MEQIGPRSGGLGVVEQLVDDCLLLRRATFAAENLQHIHKPEIAQQRRRGSFEATGDSADGEESTAAHRVVLNTSMSGTS